ncbi:mitochondrial inner membrane protease subunit 1 isoform X11 [Syngnathoides biaculeatus]|uniref:mitochondrial inner membrane protease subunit 1 isoform X11 n=1 Tax=Syngnathoides biaculeatus TaxID=300417 RepID=UPI002ADDA419|nr:mitochondrial inner membrane protease subunit 1 isoform X11 [Syngnathoides biaculeatus]
MFRRVLGKTLGFVGYTIQYGCIAHCAFEYIGEIVVCSGPSMEPTIVNKDVVFSERMTRHLCKIQKGDIVIAKSLFDPNMNVCKRVIGLEGDKVYMSGPSNLFKTQTYRAAEKVSRSSAGETTVIAFLLLSSPTPTAQACNLSEACWS